MAHALTDRSADGVDSAYAWQRLFIALVLATIGGVGLWSSVVVLPTIQAEFGINRGGAAMPYAVTLVGFAIGGIMMGRLSDRHGILVPMCISAVTLGLGYALAAASQSYWQFLVVQAVLIGMLGSSSTFGPLVADVSHWFLRKRGIAIAIVTSGNYLAGTVWPPILQFAIETVGWRQAYFFVGVFCFVTMLPLAFLLRRRPHISSDNTPISSTPVLRLPTTRPILQALLLIAGVGCCVAMAMPQVHIVAYSVDLGFGATRGAQLLSIMLGFGVVSRLVSGIIADHIGGVGTLVLGSLLQCLALGLYLPFDGLFSLYVISAVFGLAQGGIVPSYALIVRDYYPAREAGTRVSVVFMATIAGMALGGWLSGFIFDFSGSYQLAFAHAIAWNLINLLVAGWLLSTRLMRGSRQLKAARLSPTRNISSNSVGILCAIGASFAFTLNDAAIKFLSGDYPLHEVVLVRALIALTITLAVIVPLEGGYAGLKTKRIGIHVLRGLLLVMANMTFFLSLATIPLSEATAIFFVAPLMITVFSVVFLNEHVGLRRWIAVLAGLAGAIFMLRPGTSSFQYASLLPLAAALGYAGVHTLTRRIGLSEKASTMAFYIQLTFIVFSTAMGLAVGHGQYADTGGPAIEFLLRAWAWPGPQDIMVMTAIGFASAAGGYLISQAYRTCEAALIAPFEYVALVLAIIWGVSLFGEWPDLIAWTGIVLILIAGLFVFWREAALRKTVATKRPMPRHR